MKKRISRIQATMHLCKLAIWTLHIGQAAPCVSVMAQEAVAEDRVQELPKQSTARDEQDSHRKKTMKASKKGGTSHHIAKWAAVPLAAFLGYMMKTQSMQQEENKEAKSRDEEKPSLASGMVPPMEIKDKRTKKTLPFQHLGAQRQESKAEGIPPVLVRSCGGRYCFYGHCLHRKDAQET